MPAKPRKSSEIEDRVLKAVSGSDNDTGNGSVRLSSGVILKVKKVSGFLMQEVIKQFPKPKVPMWHNEDMGRDEPNPDDPTYKEQLSERDANIGLAIIDLFIVSGTQLKDIPQGIPGPADDGWTDELEAIDMEISTKPMKRYLMWVKFVACPDENDVASIVSKVGQVSGVSEESVNSAAETFRSKSRRRTNN